MSAESWQAGAGTNVRWEYGGQNLVIRKVPLHVIRYVEECVELFLWHKTDKPCSSDGGLRTVQRSERIANARSS